MALKFTVYVVQSFIKGRRKSGVISIKHSRDITRWNNVRFLPVTATCMCIKVGLFLSHYRPPYPSTLSLCPPIRTPRELRPCPPRECPLLTFRPPIIRTRTWEGISPSWATPRTSHRSRCKVRWVWSNQSPIYRMPALVNLLKM